MSRRSVVLAGYLVLYGCAACDDPVRPGPRDGLAVDQRSGSDRGAVEGGVDRNPPPTDAAPRVSTTFSSSTQNIPNPERGFYSFTEDLAELTASNLRYIRDTQGLRLAYSPTLLAAYRTTPLPQSYLDTLSANLAVVRAEGMKLVLRFAYNYDSGGQDATLAVVQQHASQLAPLLKANADVIAYLQAGFIGAWGEWHTSSNNLATDANKAAIRDALLAAAPASHPVQFRYPPDLIKWYPTVLGAGQAFGATAQARIAAHNDCFLSSNTDVGTYSSNTTLGDQQRAYIKALTELTPYGGETCDASNASEQRRGCSAILAEGRDYHLTYLNVGYYEGFINQWKAEGCYEEVARTMGYRLQLDAVAHPVSVKRGGSATVRVELRNVGWSRLFSARKLIVALRHRGSGALVSASGGNDLRTLPPQAKSSTAIEVPVAIPAGAATGEHDVLLGLPDIYSTTAGDVRFAVRFANQDDAAKDQAWEASSARFRVGTWLAVE